MMSSYRRSPSFIKSMSGSPVPTSSSSTTVGMPQPQNQNTWRRSVSIYTRYTQKCKTCHHMYNVVCFCMDHWRMTVVPPYTSGLGSFMLQVAERKRCLDQVCVSYLDSWARFSFYLVYFPPDILAVYTFICQTTTRDTCKKQTQGE